MPSYWTRFRNYYRRNAARMVFRRPVRIRSQVPLISFTFDDFPRSAFLCGGSILKRHGVTGTYYVALGLAGTEGPSGRLFEVEDLKALVAHGHELGCHTFSHCHSWNTDRDRFEQSIAQNRAELEKVLPGAKFKSLSYPISEPRPLTKKATSKHFACSRAGGQTLNAGTADLNQLSAFFLEQSRDDVQRIKDLIDRNKQVHGWTIFATHDVTSNPSQYGCSPELFEEVVTYAAQSGARILPVAEALQTLCGSES